MKKAILLILCAIFLFSACSPQRDIGANPTTPPHTPEQFTHTSVASKPTDTPSINTHTPTPIYTVQDIATLTSTAKSKPQGSNGTLSAPSAGSKAIIIDHTSIALFDQIPDRYLEAARNLKLMFADRSVGQNINEALNCLTAPSWGQTPPYCRNDYTDSNWNWTTFRPSDFTAGNVPPRILFKPDPQKYNRDNWIFVAESGVWSELTQDFIENLGPKSIDGYDVVTYQFTYLNVTDKDDIADPSKGFFANNPNKYDINDLEAFLSRYPDKTFFFWTTSLARSIGTQVSTDFNNQMRQYVLEHNKILFDVADIESHTDQGIPCFDNRDGVQYCTKQGKCEDYPDDGQNFPAICQDYTTETDGGHLGSVSGGAIQIVKAYWVLMARIAGWDGISP